MPTERKRISKARSVDEEVGHVEFGSTLGADVAESVLGPHVTAAFGTVRAGYHRPPLCDDGSNPFRRSDAPNGFCAPVTTEDMTTGQLLAVLFGFAVLVFTAGFVVVFLLS